MRNQAKLSVAVFGLLAMLGAACAQDPVSPEPPEATITPTGTPQAAGECSAGNLTDDMPELEGLPAEVETMRDQIIRAAVECDYDELEALAMAPNDAFQYSQTEESAGPEAQPAEFWRSQEEDGQRPLAALVEILSAEPEVQEVSEPEGPGTGSDESYYNFPVPSEAHPEGYRTSITSSGDWIFFLREE